VKEGAVVLNAIVKTCKGLNCGGEGPHNSWILWVVRKWNTIKQLYAEW